MTEREVLKLALEALELHLTHHEHGCVYLDPAVTAIKEALAQPEQKPVGQLLEDAFGRGQVMWFNKPKDESMLYTTQPQRKPLSNGEIYTAYITATNQTLRVQNERLAFAFARAIEAAHGIEE